MKNFLLIALLLFMNSCTNPRTDMISDFKNLFDSTFSENEPGGVILVKKDGKTVFLNSYGVEDLESGKMITPSTVFNTGSVSKTFVANAILMLSEQGKLSLEDSLFMYFKDFDSEEIAKKVKIKHLLTHTSGLPDSRPVSDNIEFYLTAKDEENFEPIKHTKTLNFEPGEKFEYSNPAFNGLALIIEKVTGKKWQTFVEDNIFNPAGMEHSKITDGPYPEEDVAHAYTLQDNVYMEDDYGETPTFAAAGNGGVWSSVLELAKYEKALQSATFLSKEMVKNSRTIINPSNWNSSTKPDVGYSWFLAGKDLNENEFDVDIISHTGWQGGFRAFYISIPEKDILYVGLFNRPIHNLSESYNPFTNTSENSSDIRVKGIKLLKSYNWLD
ncbi:MAG: serine hydrolase domain-containing protein [Balneolaceae bacterium]